MLIVEDERWPNLEYVVAWPGAANQDTPQAHLLLKPLADSVHIPFRRTYARVKEHSGRMDRPA